MSDARIVPSRFGFYWVKWRICDDGTADEEHFVPHDNWEVVELVENCTDPSHPEYKKVVVGGVVMGQSPENFVWGPRVSMLDAENSADNITSLRKAHDAVVEQRIPRLLQTIPNAPSPSPYHTLDRLVKAVKRILQEAEG